MTERKTQAEHKTELETRELRGECYDCGRRYDGGLGWIEAFVYDDAWKQINPTNPHREDGGLLCICCMAKRNAVLG